MTVRELMDYLMHCDDCGYGSVEVVICDHRDNPITDVNCIKDALIIDSRGGDSYIVLQTN